MRFAKKHNKKGLKTMQANNAKAMSTRAEAIKALVHPKEPMSQRAAAANSADSPTSLTPPWEACSCHTAKGLRLSRPKAKAKADTKPQAAGVAAAQAPKGAQAPRRLHVTLSADVTTEGLVGPLGCCPVLFVQINLRWICLVKINK
uniref:Ribosomal protein L29 n=1 Tax=Pipistrellus kuhlii TaxID=59472 RepID=A0A7J7R8Y6_PIPKU|nr:hypothetical protein mPipKuh1_010822 [Pipistrellus kuhlii]